MPLQLLFDGAGPRTSVPFTGLARIEMKLCVPSFEMGYCRFGSKDLRDLGLRLEISL